MVIPFLDSVKGTLRFWFAKVMGDDGVEVMLLEL